jgi:hypothetical protein
MRLRAPTENLKNTSNLDPPTEPERDSQDWRLLTRARIRAPFDGKISSLNNGETATPEVESTICWQAARGWSYPC